MPKLTEETLYKDLDFTCKRCGSECVKNDAIEPELGYISKVNGEWEGPICQSCANEVGEVAVKEIPEAAFLVIIKRNGQGVFITDEGIERLFIRSATPYEITSACNQVVQDIDEALFANKLLGQIAKIQSTKQSAPMMVPRKLTQK